MFLEVSLPFVGRAQSIFFFFLFSVCRKTPLVVVARKAAAAVAAEAVEEVEEVEDVRSFCSTPKKQNNFLLLCLCRCSF